MMRRRRDLAPDHPWLGLATRLFVQGAVLVAFTVILATGASKRDDVDVIVGLLGIAAAVFGAAETSISFQAEKILRRRLATQYERAYNAEAEVKRLRRLLTPTPRLTS